VLALDGRGLTLGNANIGTGTLQIDPASTLLTGGFGDPSITSAIIGQRVTVNNAGTVDLTNGGASTTDALVINGNYVGQSGRLLLQSVLGADGSASDRLVIAQGSASGLTALNVTNVDGKGGLTQRDGILVIEAAGGATTTTSAFTLPRYVAAGAYVYALFRGGVSAGTADNWYLRSSVAPLPSTSTTTPTSGSISEVALAAPQAAPGSPPLPAPPAAGSSPIPLYRMEVPVYAEVPGLVRQISIEQLDTFHDRQGDQSWLSERGVVPAAWVRAWGAHASFATGGAASPDFSGTLGGIQVGHDVYADESESGGRNHYGLFVGVARASGNVSGFALGFPAYAAGELSIDSESIGGYWTHVGAGGWYTDTVLMGSTMAIDPRSHEGIGATTRGTAATASVEAGLPIPMLPSVSVEPQLQLIWQHESIHDLDDGISSVAFHAQSAMIGRIGVRVSTRFDAMGMALQPYLRANLWRIFGGTDSAMYAGSTVLPTGVAATSAEFELGLSARLSAHGSAYATLGYTANINGPHRDMITGNAGLRWSW
jgi:outer membrane autotransporter protein